MGLKNGVPIKDDILLATVDIIALVAFAKDLLDTVRNGGGKLTTVLDKLFGLVGMLRTMVPIKYFDGQYLERRREKTN